MMKVFFSAVLSGCLAALGSDAAFAQSAPIQPAPVARAKIYVSAPPPAGVVSASESGGWRAQLEKSGVLSQSGPYRVGLPIADFGEDGPKLMFTYIPRMKDGLGSRVLMFVLRTSID